MWRLNEEGRVKKSWFRYMERKKGMRTIPLKENQQDLETNWNFSLGKGGNKEETKMIKGIVLPKEKQSNLYRGH